MSLNRQLLFFCYFTFALLSCSGKANSSEKNSQTTIQDKLRIGIEQLDRILPELTNKSVALVANQTSVLDGVHLVDTLIALGIDVKKVFAPEHGFRGDHDAGAKVKDDIDAQTGLSLISLHGKSKKPSKENLQDVDVIVFDIQDVGVRFYTYISTLHYVMEAAAENNIKVIVLDRPNYHDHYVDGPVLKKDFKSFVGMHPVPVVYGMTIGEYAKMINGEFWLEDSINCDLMVVSIENYQRGSFSEELTVSPSPNLPNKQSILLYPSLCFFEGTVVSVGRGTDFPFQVYGHPDLDSTQFKFIPVSKPGFAKYPKLQDKVCFGLDLRETTVKGELDWKYLVDAYSKLGGLDSFFLPNHFIDLLAGTDELRKGLIKGWTEKEIKTFYEADLIDFKKLREKYLLYP